MESSVKRPLFLSPSCRPLETSTGCSVDNLFSPIPMDLGTEERGKDRRSTGSYCSSTIATPRRKLSLDADENAQSPLACEDAGYGGSQGSCSGLESSVTRDTTIGTLEPPLEELSSIRSETKPFSVVNAESSARRRTLQARRLRKQMSSSGLQENYKRSISNDTHVPIRIPRAASLSHRPSSLPSSPVPFDGTPGHRPSSLLRQINSPLERMSLMSPVNSHPLYPSNICRSPSISSSVAESDGYFSEVFDGDGEEVEESIEDHANAGAVPDAISTLFSAPMANFAAKFDPTRPGLVCPTPVRPSASLTSSLPASFSIGPDDSGVAGRPTRRGSLKRSSPCSESTNQQRAKRPPLPVFQSNSNSSPPKKALKGTPLFRSQSYSVSHSDKNIFPGSPGNDDRELTGDFSKPCILPLVKGNVADLKCISPETLSDLLNDAHSHEVSSYTVIDCRYPYEYDGGHIPGAINIWDKDSLLERFFGENLPPPCQKDEVKRSIIVYHCEFSSKRGPDMSRFMRKIDRERNGMNFPRLYYPELYLLLGGYKAFYEKFPLGRRSGFFVQSCDKEELCEPKSYRTMADENHTADLKHFKQRSKSWNGEMNSRKRKPLLRHRRATVYDQPSAHGDCSSVCSSSRDSSPSTN